MAETAIAGISGSFLLTGHHARVSQWDAVITQDVNDCSGFGQAANWRENLGGMKVLRGSAAGYVTTAAASTAPAADFTASNDATGIAFTLTCKTGCTYTGTAIVNNVRVGTGINGNAVISFDFVSTATVTEAWATT